MESEKYFLNVDPIIYGKIRDVALELSMDVYGRKVSGNLESKSDFNFENLSPDNLRDLHNLKDVMVEEGIPVKDLSDKDIYGLLLDILHNDYRQR